VRNQWRRGKRCLRDECFPVEQRLVNWTSVVAGEGAAVRAASAGMRFWLQEIADGRK
jgi:hypothetical protein